MIEGMNWRAARVNLEDAIEIAFLVFVDQHLARPLTARDTPLQDQLAALETQVHAFRGDAWHVGEQGQLSFGFVNVDTRSEKERTPGRLALDLGPVFSCNSCVGHVLLLLKKGCV